MKTKVRVIILGLLAVVVIAVGFVVAAPVLRWKMEAPEVIGGPVQSCGNGQIARLLWKQHYKTYRSPDINKPPLGTMFLEVISSEGKVTVAEFPTEIRMGAQPDLQWAGEPEMLLLGNENKLFRFIPESRTFAELVVPIYNPWIVSCATARNGEVVVVASEVRGLNATTSVFTISSITMLRCNLAKGSIDTSVTIPFAHGARVSMLSTADSLSLGASHIVYQKGMRSAENANETTEIESYVSSLDPFSSEAINYEVKPEEPTDDGTVEIADVLTGQPVFSRDIKGKLMQAWWSPSGTRCLLRIGGNRNKPRDIVGDYWLVDINNKQMENIAGHISSVLDGSEKYLKVYGIDWIGGDRFFVATLAKSSSSGNGEDQINVVFDTATWDLFQLPFIGKYSVAMAAGTRPLVALRTVGPGDDDPKMCIVRIGPDENDSGSSVTQVPLKTGENPSWLWGCGDTKLLLLEGGKVREVTVP